jgi:serine/threonine protein kinase
VHSHVEALAGDDAELFRAPEFRQPNARPASLDVFGLGALGLFILTGERPAASARQLRETLSNVGYLDPTAVADGLDPALAEVVIATTAVDPTDRVASADDLLVYLDAAEEEWASDDSEDTHPLDARRGDTLASGRFEVVQRLGKGSSAVALLVKDSARFDQLCVAKVANETDNNDRLLDEAAALDGIQHTAIVSLLEDPLELSGHVTLLIGYAGPKIDPDRAELRDGRTLASRLADGPVGAELAQRWGEDLLDALRYLEGMGRAHRDIKPENLGVAPRGKQNHLHLVLFDFSLSNAPVDALAAGTPGYIDPFLESRGRWDPAADRFSAAVTLFEMVTGTRPRYGDGDVDPALVPALPTVDEAMFDSAVAPGLVGFFTKALQPDVRDRFDTADEMFWSWHEAFDAADSPSTPSLHPDDDLVLPEGVTIATPLAALPLSRRAVSALELSEILTVADLLALPIMQLRSLPGVGATTRGEIREALDLLRTRFDEHSTPDSAEPPMPRDEEAPVATDADPSPEDETAVTPRYAVGSVAELAAATLPVVRRSDQSTQAELARTLAGLEASRDPWASQRHLAEWLGVTRGRVSQLVTALRKRWLKDPSVKQFRDEIRAELGTLRVASVDQLATRILVAHSPEDRSDAATNIARGLVRIATMAEERLTAPGWIVRRGNGAVLLSASVDDDSGPSADDLADYGFAAGAAASALIGSRDFATRRELLDELRRVPKPPGAEPLPDSHLADLAADLCEAAAVNSRLELYRVGLDPVHALRLARRAFVTNETFSPAAMQSKITARFPAAAPLPTRPELDGAIKQAGVELVWNDAEAVYANPQHEAAGSSTSVASLGRYPTNSSLPVPPVEIDNADEFERRLVRAHNNGGLLVLTADRRELDTAQSALARVADTSVDFDEWLIGSLREITATGKPTFETLITADAAGETAGNWPRLQAVVDTAIDRLTDQLAATNNTVLLTNLGLLARFDRLNVVASWRERLQSGDHAIQALWLLIPSAAATEMPTVDAKPVPVISRNEWGQIPSDWLRNAHRAIPPDGAPADRVGGQR